ncbi:excinuclease ABC subunit C, partial [Mesorhizobium sp. M7A.F.Ca.CA.002.09.1.1]
MSPVDHKSKPRGGTDDLPPDIDLEDEAVEEIVETVGPDVAFTAIDWTPHAGDAEGMIGAEVIQTLVKRLPNAPGVYRMMNAAGDVLYVGKARSLKKRVTNYAQGRFHTTR